ncbi:hypothetical protein QQ008_05785 [Fulvivirgaceae bacterium BMA10]|uniref:Uncharacterized protein n=1 Tax=Splendidivirga corallicola TaxID=3051826 RepID=A0ABT8KKU9_9BACT|nr:hypothetical protein [Fulvivirgaceae bacterium BMA10]
MIIVALILVSTLPIPSVLLVILAIFIFTTYYGLDISLDDKYYWEYIWLFGFRKGKKRNFSHIEYLYITKNRYTQTLGIRGPSTTIRAAEYHGLIKFSNDEKIHLCDSKIKQKVIKRLRSYATHLKVEIFDLTEGKARLIE